MHNHTVDFYFVFDPRKPLFPVMNSPRGIDEIDYERIFLVLGEV